MDLGGEEVDCLADRLGGEVVAFLANGDRDGPLPLLEDAELHPAFVLAQENEWKHEQERVPIRDLSFAMIGKFEVDP
jgi:hypothetical protein